MENWQVNMVRSNKHIHLLHVIYLSVCYIKLNLPAKVAVRFPMHHKLLALGVELNRLGNMVHLSRFAFKKNLFVRSLLFISMLNMFAKWFHINLFAGNHGVHQSQPLESNSQGRSIGEYGIMSICGTSCLMNKVRQIVHLFIRLLHIFVLNSWITLWVPASSARISWKILRYVRWRCFIFITNILQSHLICFISDLLVKGELPTPAVAVESEGIPVDRYGKVQCVFLHCFFMRLHWFQLNVQLLFVHFRECGLHKWTRATWR